MADGTLSPIEELATGDLVLSTDPATGATAAQPVLAPITGTGTKHLVDVVTDAGTWTATANHPIWVQGKGWTEAGDLTAGDQLVGSTGGLLVVQAMHDLGWLSGQTVHNLSIGTTHTYYIASPDGTVDALVHNCPGQRLVPGSRLGTVLERMPLIGGRSRLFGNTGLGARVPGLLNNKDRVVRIGWSVNGDGIKGGARWVTFRRFDPRTGIHKDLLAGRRLN